MSCSITKQCVSTVSGSVLGKVSDNVWTHVFVESTNACVPSAGSGKCDTALLRLDTAQDTSIFVRKLMHVHLMQGQKKANELEMHTKQTSCF